MISKTAVFALQGLVTFIVWVTGIIVSLAVGFGMVDGVLTVNFMPEAMTVAAGWVVIVLTISSALLAIIERLIR